MKIEAAVTNGKLTYFLINLAKLAELNSFKLVKL